MARLFSANGMYLRKSVGLLAATPFTVAGWMNCSSFAHWNNLWTMITPKYYEVHLDSTGHVITNANDGAADNAAVSSTALALNTWGHVCGVYASTTSRTSYLNAGGAVSNTVLTNPAPCSETDIGGDAFANWLAGSIAFFGMWSVALSLPDIVALAAGAHPLLVQPAKLVACVDMTGGSSPEPDLVSATPWTILGAPVESVNPRIYGL